MEKKLSKKTIDFTCAPAKIRKHFYWHTSILRKYYDNNIKKYTLFGVFFVLITGTLFHFLYDWTNQNSFIGLIAPVNESIWEHMKLVFFPMLLYSPILSQKLKENHPCIISAIAFGILLGTFLIPILFYTYTSILGKNIFLFDLATFILSTIIAFIAIYLFTLSCKLQPYTILLYGLLLLLFLCFILFTGNPPDFSIFDDPAAS